MSSIVGQKAAEPVGPLLGGIAAIIDSQLFERMQESTSVLFELSSPHPSVEVTLYHDAAVWFLGYTPNAVVPDSNISPATMGSERKA